MDVFIAASSGRDVFQNEKEEPSQRLWLLLFRLGVFRGCWKTRVFEDQRALSLVLEEKDLLFAIRAFRILDLFDKPGALLAVEPDIAADGFRKAHSDPLAASYLGKGVDDFLWERLE